MCKKTFLITFGLLTLRDIITPQDLYFLLFPPIAIIGVGLLLYGLYALLMDEVNAK